MTNKEITMAIYRGYATEKQIKLVLDNLKVSLESLMKMKKDCKNKRVQILHMTKDIKKEISWIKKKYSL